MSYVLIPRKSGTPRGLSVRFGKEARGKNDFATTALRIVERTIGEKLDGTPLDDPDAGKNQNAIARGKKGGPARAAALTPRKRKQIAKRGAEARWGKKPAPKKRARKAIGKKGVKAR